MKQELKNQCQLIQDDLDCVLDNIDDETVTKVCQVVVDRFAILHSKMNEMDELIEHWKEEKANFGE